VVDKKLRFAIYLTFVMLQFICIILAGCKSNIHQETITSDLPKKVAEIGVSEDLGPADLKKESGIALSDENDFEAVSARQTIESDAKRLFENRQLYSVIEPEDLPLRSGTNIPNIVEYALRTNNPIGVKLYHRTIFAKAQVIFKNCDRYPSSSKAQEDFIKTGGPKWDLYGLDPDGDGFACDWDPAPFRSVRADE